MIRGVCFFFLFNNLIATLRWGKAIGGRGGGGGERRVLRESRGIELHLFFCQDNQTQELIFQTLHGDSEVDDWGPGADLRSVGGVGQLGGDVHAVGIHHITLLVSYFHLHKRD